MNGIHHIRSAPHHPTTNGLAYHAVQTLNESLKKTAPGSLQARVSHFLFTYRITPHTTTGVSPAELLMARQLRSHLSLLHPDTAMQKRVNQKQRSQKKHHDLRDVLTLEILCMFVIFLQVNPGYLVHLQ